MPHVKVTADAVRRGVTLPIWRDGKVLFAHPATGEIFTSEPPPSPPDATRDQQTTLDRNDEERLDALRALGIVLPFDATKTKATRADND